MFELHVWGPLDESVPSFDPECLAAMWLVSSLASDDFTVVRSSNSTVHPSGILPALRHDSKPVAAGYDSIVRYLGLQGLALNDDDRSTVLLSYVQSHMAVVTSYVLYLYKENYEKVTRPLFTELLPFPMQYNAAITQRDEAYARCEAAGLESFNLAGKDEDIMQPKSSQFTTLSKLHEQIEHKKEGITGAMESTKELMRASAYADDVLSTIEDAHDLQHQKNLSSVDLLLLAHLYVQMAKAFPGQVTKPLLETGHAVTKSYFNRLIPEVTALKIPIAETRPQDVPNLTNWLLSFW
ncbi:hypothetical protein TRVA0_035S00408 [Trichomonascus vanleenenianus]|uniref:SAM complex subunit SAM37 n=1 Tax=Trichomonascus vanleenenianus TaxID=2268995 RepID=UPI003ECAABF6